MVELVVEPYNIRVEADRGERVYDVLKRAGIPFRTECGGRGLCGKCRVIVKGGAVSAVTPTELRLLSQDELEAGYRLACQTFLEGSTALLVPPESRSGGLEVAASGFARSMPFKPLAKKVFLRLRPPSLEAPRSDFEVLLEGLGYGKLKIEYSALKSLAAKARESNWEVTATIWRGERIVNVEAGDTARHNYGAAVDVGTTKIVLHLVDLDRNTTLTKLSIENPQTIYGDDIVSRIHAALQDPRSLSDMQKMTVTAINNLLRAARATAGLEWEHLTSAVVVGNTVMHHVFLGLDVKGLGFSPYIPSVRDSMELPGGLLGLEGVDYVYLPPNIAGYVGGDAVADIIATGIHLLDKPSLLVDIGTNTEIILNTGERLLTCSAPSGPAFEGGHIKHGMKAMVGAIRKVVVSGVDRVEYEVIGGGKPLGIAGSALIDVIAGLLETGVLTPRGFFDKNIASWRISRSSSGDGREFILVRAEESLTGKEITVSEKDVGEIRLAKAAIYSGIAVLLERSGLKPEDLEEVFIAGSFGYNVDVVNAMRIGMIPRLDPSRVRAVGNTAVEGARLMLTSESAVEEAERVAREAEYVELTLAPEFKRIFPRSLMFPEG